MEDCRGKTMAVVSYTLKLTFKGHVDYLPWNSFFTVSIIIVIYGLHVLLKQIKADFAGRY